MIGIGTLQELHQHKVCILHYITLDFLIVTKYVNRRLIMIHKFYKCILLYYDIEETVYN